MISNEYKNAFKEVYEILQNTEDELLEKIPSKFIDFLQKNMNTQYITNIDTKIDIDKQKLLPETEAILALIYRSYWVSNEAERQEFANIDKKALKEAVENKKNKYKDISEIFNKRKNIDNITLDNKLIVIKKETIMQKFIKKILGRLKIKNTL